MSNDNPFSESQFKTPKYQPDYPGRFDGMVIWLGMAEATDKKYQSGYECNPMTGGAGK